MKKVMMCLFAVVLFSIFAAGTAFSEGKEEGTCSSGCPAMKEEVKENDLLLEKEVINSVCPVMGGKIKADTPFKAEYNGKIIGFCCEGCISAFEKDPEKYMKIIEQQAANDQ